MLIHSIVSLSDIFYNSDEIAKPAVYRRVGGGIVETDGEKVIRLISTDPRQFLDKRYTPGSPLK
ncbi:MAG: hypothetical protein IJT87_00725 [Ruminiclostridium sp.]|nr:hypothetical protein [Ruminiclostridium sp.]